jgi:hypothetical protein
LQKKPGVNDELCCEAVSGSMVATDHLKGVGVGRPNGGRGCMPIHKHRKIPLAMTIASKTAVNRRLDRRGADAPGSVDVVMM